MLINHIDRKSDEIRGKKRANFDGADRFVLAGSVTSPCPNTALANHISLCLCVLMNETEFFKALADPTRRAVFERLADGEMNATALRQGFAMSQPAISQHLAVLRSAGLIAEQKLGRNVMYRINPDGIARMHQWLSRYHAFWPKRVDELRQLLKEMDQ